MMYSPSLMPLCLGILSCLGPTIFFAGVNATWFSKRQITCSIFVSTFLGIAIGLGLTFFSSIIVAFCSFLVFFIFGERFFHIFLQNTKHKIYFIVIGETIVIATTIYFGLLPLLLLLLLFTLISLSDLYRKWSMPKNNIFSRKKFKKNNIKIYEKSNIILKYRPNIYVLFLESMHSAQALRLLYNKNSNLSEILERNRFIVFDNVFSNECTTRHSLNSLLFMKSPAHNIVDTIPVVFSVLRTNGYKISIYDNSIYAFGEYIQYVDFFNFYIPKVIMLLCDLIPSIFLQSKFFNFIIKNINIFEDNVDFDKVKKIFIERIKKNDKYQCHIIRFGANHSPISYRHNQRETWNFTYCRLYQKACKQIVYIIEQILRNDPQACIVALGDHGAWSYRGVWRSLSSDCNKSMLDQGIKPDLVGLDLAGVFCAVRPPDGDFILPPKVCSPCNLFRYVFQLLGANPSQLERAPDISYLHDEGQASYIIAKNGFLLKNWEIDNGQSTQQKNFSVGRITDLAKQAELTGDIKNAISVYEEGILHNPGDVYLLSQLGELFLRIGHANTCRQRLLPIINEKLPPWGAILLLHPLLISMVICGAKRHAFLLLMMHPSVNNLTYIAYIRLKVNLYHVSGNLNKSEKAFIPLIRRRTQNLEQLEQQRIFAQLRALYLDAAGKTKKAVASLDNFYDKNPFRAQTQAFAGLFCYSAALSMRLGDWTDSECRLRWILDEVKPAYPVTLQLWLAGTLEQQGRLKEAQSLHEDVYAQSQAVPHLGAQLGMFYLRQKPATPRFPEALNDAQAYLDTTDELIAPIFDATWYARTYHALVSTGNLEPRMHFLHYWRVLGLDPNPFFNTIFYRLYNNPIFNGGNDIIWHFLAQKPYQWFDPSLNFCTIAYISQHNDVDWTQINPLAHKIQSSRT